MGRGFEIALVLPVLAALLTLGGAARLLVEWKNAVGTLGARVWHTISLLVALVYLWSLNSWNLLGWRM